MTKDNWISLAGIIIQLIIAIGSYLINKNQLSKNNKKLKLDNLISKLDNLREKSCEYWGKQSMTPEYQGMLELEIKSSFEDIKFILKGLYESFKSIRSDIHKIQTNEYVDLNKLITGGAFETMMRSCDKNKCNEIIKNIAFIKEKIGNL